MVGPGYMRYAWFQYCNVVCVGGRAILAVYTVHDMCGSKINVYVQVREMADGGSLYMLGCAHMHLKSTLSNLC